MSKEIVILVKKPLGWKSLQYLEKATTYIYIYIYTANNAVFV